MLFEENRAWRTNDLTEVLGIGKGSLYKLLSNLHVRKVYSKWVPYRLTDGQKLQRLEACQTHLHRLGNEPDFLDRIVANDETWIRSYDPLDSRAAKEWRYEDVPR